jgi:hypothetical protein
VLRASDSQAAITRPGAVGSATATLTLTARIATLPDAEQRLALALTSVGQVQGLGYKF